MVEKWDPRKQDWVDAFENAPEEKPNRGLRLLAIGLAATLLIVGATVITISRGGEAPADTARAPQPASSPSLPSSRGITQTQLDALGDSIEARYRSGDTEVAQALLNNFMDAHPECVSSVMAGGEGTMRDVLRSSEPVADYLRSTAPYPDVYTTVITNRVDGVVKAAVLGVSCQGDE